MKQYYIGIALACAGIFGLFYYTHRTKPKDDVIIVGTNAEFQPFTFVDEKGTIVGCDIDVARELCNRLGKKVVFHNMSFDALIPEVQLGTVHLVAAGMTPTPERAKRVFFLNPHLQGAPIGLVVPFDTQEVNPLVWLKTKRVAVNQGYTSENYVVSQGAPFVIQVAGASVSDGILTLESGQADCYAVASNVIKPFFERDGYHRYIFLVLPNSQESTALAVSKQYPQLYEQAQKVLSVMEQDGTIKSIMNKWGLL